MKNYDLEDGYGTYIIFGILGFFFIVFIAFSVFVYQNKSQCIIDAKNASEETIPFLMQNGKTVEESITVTDRLEKIAIESCMSKKGFFVDNATLIIGFFTTFFVSFILLFLYLRLFDLKLESLSFVATKTLILTVIFSIIGFLSIIFGFVGAIVGNLLAIVVVSQMLGYSFLSAFLFLLSFGVVNYIIILLLSQLF